VKQIDMGQHTSHAAPPMLSHYRLLPARR